jgi:hypothetical protein
VQLFDLCDLSWISRQSALFHNGRPQHLSRRLRSTTKPSGHHVAVAVRGAEVLHEAFSKMSHDSSLRHAAVRR